MKRTLTPLALAFAMLHVAAPAVAQPADAAVETGPIAPTWTTPETQDVGQMLSGVWMSTAVPQADGAASVPIIMAIAPVKVEGVEDALYVEIARSDATFEPYRQAIFQIYRYKSGLRLRTYELRNDPGIKNAIVGLAYAPEHMPRLTRDDLLATLDLDLTKGTTGYAGKTPYPYPTGVGGAVEMTSQIQFSPTNMVTSDSGFGPDGSVVWGAKSGERYGFAKAEPTVKVTRTPEGVVIMTFVEGQGEPLKDSQLATVHYTGYIDSGFSFDSSRKRPQPMTFRWPGQMIAGWNIGVANLTKGERRRIIIPAELGYGENGNPQARIPGNSRLIFDLECVLIQDASSPSVPTQQPTSSGH